MSVRDEPVPEPLSAHPSTASFQTRRHGSVAALAVAVVAVFAQIVAPAGADARPAPGCDRLFLLVHDMAGSAAQMSAFAERIGVDPECTVVADYGATPLTEVVRRAGGPDAAGFTAVDDSARAVGTLMQRSRPDAGWTVIAHGAGGLVVQRAIQLGLTGAPVAHLITVGPIWRGTNLAALGDTEDLSRRLGTYDAVLALEKPLIDPWCAGCRELVRGSDLLVRLHRAGLPTPGVRYSNVISSDDILVSDPRTAAMPGMDNRILRGSAGRRTAHHFELLVAPDVISTVRDVVGGH